jgi:hypothetical protein
MTEDDVTTVETWTCEGRRWSQHRAKLYTVWRRPNGEDATFIKVDGVLGSQYEVTISEPDGTLTLHGTPRYLGPAPDLDSAQRAVWELAEKQARTDQETHRLQASERRRSEIDQALEPLLAVAGRVRGYSSRKALADYVTARLYGA